MHFRGKFCQWSAWMILLVMMIASAPIHSKAQGLGMNEVSQLLPLPSVPEFNALLSPVSVGSRGELLPYSVFRFLPILSDRADQEQLYRYNLKIIGVRFDPCFGEGKNPVACRPQIRFVWQPLIVVGNQVTTLDTAIHTFHEFDAGEWALIVSEMQTFVRSGLRYPLGAALDVQPNLRSEGYRGNYWKGFTAILLRHCGEQNLIRVTAMTVRMERVWHFMGLDRTVAPAPGRNGSWSMIQIPTLDIEPKLTSQSFFLQPEGMENLEEFNGGISYLPKSERPFMRLTSDSIRIREIESEPTIKAVIRRAIQLENPRMHNPGTADCVSCHMAQTVRLWGEKNYPKWDWSREFVADRFQVERAGSTSSGGVAGGGAGVGAIDLGNRSVNPFRTDRMRAFGYFGRDPILSQRVIHETSLVVSKLQR
jgi:hypothetical protein